MMIHQKSTVCLYFILSVFVMGVLVHLVRQSFKVIQQTQEQRVSQKQPSSTSITRPPETSFN